MHSRRWQTENHLVTSHRLQRTVFVLQDILVIGQLAADHTLVEPAVIR